MLPRLVQRKPQRPRQEWPRRIVAFKVFPQRQRRFLHHIPRILRPRQQCTDIAIQIPLRLQKEPKEIAVRLAGGFRVFHSKQLPAARTNWTIIFPEREIPCALGSTFQIGRSC